jgi:hypothetical protein
MNRIKQSTGQHITERQIKQEQPNISFAAESDLSEFGYPTLESVAQPTAEPGERVTAGDPEEYEPGKWREVWNVTAIPLAEMQTQRLAELAALRYTKETAGIILNGATIETNRESQSLINGAWSYSQLNPSVLIDWKAESGWIQIDAATIAGIAGAVAAHVQACFSNERNLSEAITAAETVAAVQAIDLTIGWP